MMSKASAMAAKIQTLWRQEGVPFVTAYVLGGVLSVLGPAIKYWTEVRSYRTSYNYQYNQDDNQNGQGDERREWDVNNCKWWQVWCTPLWVNENGEYVQEDQGDNGQSYSTPTWFSGWGNANRQGERREDDVLSNSSALKFVYTWQTLLFLALLTYGALILLKFRKQGMAQSRMAIQSLFLALFLWTNFSFLTMWLLANGSIAVEGRELEEVGGFYLQLSVVLFLTNFWQFVWGIAFCIVLGFRSCRKHKQGDGEQMSATTDGAAMEQYLPYCEPTISVTDSSHDIIKNTNDNHSNDKDNTHGFI